MLSSQRISGNLELKEETVRTEMPMSQYNVQEEKSLAGPFT